MQRKDTAKIFASIGIIVFAISIMPILAVSFFNHAAADDLSFGGQAFIAWRETGAFAAVFRVAWDNVVRLYGTWQGTYTGIFLMTLQPGLFGEQYYFVGTFVLLFGLIFSVLYLSKIILRDYLGATFWQWLAISVPPLAVCIQTLSNGRDSFLWFNGGVLYTFTFSMYLVLLALVLKFMRKPCVITGVLISVLGFLTAGGAIPVAMLCFMTGIISVACLFVRRHSARYGLLAAVIPIIAGSLISVFAPGNAVRAEFVAANAGNFGQVPLLGVPFVAVVYGTWTTFLTINLAFLLVMVLVSPFVLQLLEEKNFAFKYPAAISVLSFMLVCAMYLPLVYGTGFALIDRYVNIVQIAIWILGVANVFYWLGWAVTVKGINFNFRIKHPVVVLCAIAVVAIFSTARIAFSAEPGGRGTFAVAAPFSAVILYEFFTGEIEAYHAAYRNLLDFMEGNAEYPPDFRTFPQIVPSVFVSPFSTDENADFPIEWFVYRMSFKYGRPLPIP